jgi:hypothetical protein
MSILSQSPITPKQQKQKSSKSKMAYFHQFKGCVKISRNLVKINVNNMDGQTERRTTL